MADFANSFKGPGNLMRVRIDSLPVNGILKFNNAPIIPNTEINRTDLSKLTYTANSGPAILDSIVWNGSNGIRYTTKSAVMKVNIISPYYSIGNGSWSNPATWVNGIIPPAGADVIINTHVTVDINITCNSLQIMLSSSLTINTGSNVTILK